jgi:hypothetical protein
LLGRAKALLGVASQGNTVVDSRYFNQLRRRGWRFVRRRRRGRRLDWCDGPAMATRAVVLGFQLQVGSSAGSRCCQVFQTSSFARILQTIILVIHVNVY